MTLQLQIMNFHKQLSKLLALTFQPFFFGKYVHTLKLKVPYAMFTSISGTVKIITFRTNLTELSFCTIALQRIFKVSPFLNWK